MEWKDNRLKALTEIFKGIKMLKMYAWEPSFKNHVADLRNMEVGYIRNVVMGWCAISILWDIMPFMVMIVTFITYVYSDSSHIITAEKAFVSLALFNLLRWPMTFLPWGITESVTAFVSMKRISAFLVSKEIDHTGINHLNDVPSENPEEDSVVDIRNGSFSWKENDKLILKEINLNVKRGKLVAIVGRVGVGKSSLLNAILGEMCRVDGSIIVKGEIAYVPQEAWIQNMSVRENVLFTQASEETSPEEEERYHMVIGACALQPDLNMLAAGDATEIGERGINLSGGQKQRVSLARAVFQDKDVYLLDDPLSSVDAHVGLHLFSQVISSQTGMLRHKTRILVTHGVHWLPRVDEVVVLAQDGSISERGSYKDLMRDGQEFKRFIQEYLDANIVTNQSNNEENVAEAKRLLSVMSEDNDALEQLINIVPLSPPSKDGMAGPKTTLEDSTDSQKLSRRSSENPQWGARISDTEIDRKTSGTSVKQFQRPTGSINQSNTIPINGSEGGSDPDHRGLSHKLIKPLGQLTDDEDAMSGRVKWSTYLGYFNSWRPWVFCISVFSYLTFSGFQVAANIWLERFTSDPLITNATGQIPKHNANKNEEMIERVDYYMIYYGTFGVCQVFSISLFWLFFMFGIIRASRLLHIRLLDGILRVPMSFFDTTPSGRILNRFSKDIDQIDHVIPFNLSDAITCFIQAVTSVIVIIIVTPWFMLLVLPLAIIYYLIQLFYLPTCRQSRRLGSIASSPIFSHFTETLTGCSVVRAFRTQVNFQQINHSLVNRSNTFLFLQYASTRWLSVRLDALGNLMVFGSVLFALIDRDNLTPSLVGLSVSYALQMTDLLNWLVRQYSELETNSVALERVHEYSMVPSEAAWDNPDTEPGASWPTCGAVKLSDLSVRYRDGLPLVLTGVSADLCSGERVGVVGRTGAGKSSLAQALFRLVEPAGGSIFIDQVDISCLGLHRLRAGITILPQDPIVFSGSLRTNLDPLHRYKDKQLWDALRHSHLYEWASTLQQPPAATVGISDPLLYECGESGANLSTGQKQLLCLARALLRKSRVLILDEATASVDVETDRLVMQTVRKQFQESTVIIIAHRVNTILDCDRVLVLDQGRIAELDTPQNLLSRPGGSLFKSLADQSNRPSDL